ncbi:MAG: hypothetical protein M0Z72_04690 [Deltaproteobacteria bacterium]|nr:hypothetical protein [Deltaproteobacteria bacterium]
MANKKVVFISVPYLKDPERRERLSLLGVWYVRSQGKTVLRQRQHEYDAVVEDCKVMLARCDEALFIDGAGGLSNRQRIELVTAQKLRKEITITETRTLFDLVLHAVMDKEVIKV